MPKALARFKKGMAATITCYRKGCENTQINVVLGDEYEIHPSFRLQRGAGRILWRFGSAMKGFELGETLGGSGYCNCPNCRTLFGGVIVISNGRFKKPSIIGYDPSPA